MTAIGNDYSYDEVFARQVLAAGRPGDVVIGLSTSGNSVNVAIALEVGRMRRDDHSCADRRRRREGSRSGPDRHPGSH